MRGRNVLVIGVDGVRYDTLLGVRTPVLDMIAQEGFLRAVQVHPAGPTISGPSWATIVTGVSATVHGIQDNNLEPNHLADNPDFVHLARLDGLQTFIGADWAPLVTSESGGPLFADGGFLPDRGVRDEPAEWHRVDQDVTERGVDFLADLDGARGSASFVYLHAVDTAGHRRGVGDVYREFVEESDRRIGELITAVESRPTRADEDWLIIVVTDHGHRDEGGHGEDSPEERTAWIAAAGLGIKSLDETAVLEQADVAGQVMATLGLTPRSDDFAGLPFGDRRSGIPLAVH